jgi:hypothetical protein
MQVSEVWPEGATDFGGSSCRSESSRQGARGWPARHPTALRVCLRSFVSDCCGEEFSRRKMCIGRGFRKKAVLLQNRVRRHRCQLQAQSCLQDLARHRRLPQLQVCRARHLNLAQFQVHLAPHQNLPQLAWLLVHHPKRLRFLWLARARLSRQRQRLRLRPHQVHSARQLPHHPAPCARQLHHLLVRSARQGRRRTTQSLLL